MTKIDNMKAARSTYENFTTLFKWGTIIVAVVTALVIVIIS